MKLLSGKTQFEEAAVIRDRIKAIESVMETQNVVGDPRDELDVVGFASSGDLSALTCIFVRSGLIVGRYDLGLKGLYSAEEAIDAFIGDYYRKGVSIPPLILFPVGLDFAPAHAEILSELCGRSVRLRHPLRGRKVKLLEMAAENAAHALKAAISDENAARSIITELKTSMKLNKLPKRIECLDISHTSGKYTVGGIVVWQEGKFRRDQYRLFSIRNSAKPGDDFSAIDEVIKRRYAGSVSSELPDPDLLLIDGGKGQLSVATAAIDELDMSGGWSTAAITKSRQARKLGQPEAADEVFIPDRLNPVHFRKTSKSYQVLRQIRDEAHRFTVTAHRRKRGKEDLFSILERVEGIGPARRKALLTNFRSLEEIRNAEPDEITRLKGFNHELAERVKEILK
jgi:excinuclease ABC subunit C